MKYKYFKRYFTEPYWAEPVEYYRIQDTSVAEFYSPTYLSWNKTLPSTTFSLIRGDLDYKPATKEEVNNYIMLQELKK